MERQHKKVVYNSKGFVVRTNEVLTSTSADADVQQCRKELALTPLAPKMRTCLRCGEHFESEGWHNRVCFLCKVDYRFIQGTDDSMPIEFKKSQFRMVYENRRKK